MLEGVLRYAQNFSSMLGDANYRKLLFSEINKYFYLNTYIDQIGDPEKDRALRMVIAWLATSQDAMRDDGFGTFYIKSGWTSSYPETSGYIVPTLIDYAGLTADTDYIHRATRCLDWLHSIQFREGGWQSGYVHQLRDAVVFNTGQVVRGLLAGQALGRPDDLAVAAKACHWMVKVQQPEGYWSKHNFLGVARVYDSYVAAPMLKVAQLTSDKAIENAALKNLEWVVSQKQQANGWFIDCDNTRHKNHMPITHTIAYTIDGLLDSGLLLGNDNYIKAAALPAQILADQFLEKGRLSGRYDTKWNGHESFITTGGAQLAIIWLKLYQYNTNDAHLLAAAKKMNALLAALQERSVAESPNTKGALFGSFPLWGKYEAFGLPNWANKYFADSLMLEMKLR
ncbi:MAG: hypothetical protein LAT76_01055 [Schleiferiaceae bacterium]|nr:hypothetical protein [Schleiferiaceae bacterium]